MHGYKFLSLLLTVIVVFGISSGVYADVGECKIVTLSGFPYDKNATIEAKEGDYFKIKVTNKNDLFASYDLYNGDHQLIISDQVGYGSEKQPKERTTIIRATTTGTYDFRAHLSLQKSQHDSECVFSIENLGQSPALGWPFDDDK